MKQGCPLSPLLFIISYDPLLVALSSPVIKIFAFADDIALIVNTVSDIFPALGTISLFGLLSGLGVNRSKSVVIPTSDPERWPYIQEEIHHSPWPDLPVRASGTHLGIVVGRDTTLDDVWKVPYVKATERLRVCGPFIKSLSLASRVTFINVFIISIFSYVSLFFTVPIELWTLIKGVISRAIIPYNGRAFTYETLICSSLLMAAKPALKDLWAFNISLLAVRSTLYDASLNYNTLPTINLKYNMHINDHRNAAAVDFWRGRHEASGRLIPVCPSGSPEVYKSIISDVYCEDASIHLNSKILSFIHDQTDSTNTPPELADFGNCNTFCLIDKLDSTKGLPYYISWFYLKLINNALATSRRMRHQNNIRLQDVASCFFCGEGQDSVLHIFSSCSIIHTARVTFLKSISASLAELLPSLFLLQHVYLLGIDKRLTRPLLAFNFAVWNYRKPALAARLVRDSYWLINHIVDLSFTTLNSFKATKIKRTRSIDPVVEALSHNRLVCEALPSTLLCYTDGSASPNPGPCGAGAACFLPSAKIAFDLGASLGNGSNNIGELYALGMLFTYLLKLSPTVHWDRVLIFSDSKLAINSVLSTKRPIANFHLVSNLRKLFLVLKTQMDVAFHWVKGHAAIGGNERADKISKRFALSECQMENAQNDESFPSTVATRDFSIPFPITDLPSSFFLDNLLSP